MLRTLVRAREYGLIALAALVGLMAGLVVAAMSFSVGLLHQPAVRRAARRDGCRPQPSSIRSSQSRCRRSAAWPSGWGCGRCCAGAPAARSTRSRPMRCMAGACRRAAASSLRCRPSGRAESAPRSGSKRATRSWRAAWRPGSGRRSACADGDLRVLVGCGAAGAIAGAFGAPLAGAFYAFELVIASYSAVHLAPVGAAALVGYLVASTFGRAEPRHRLALCFPCPQHRSHGVGAGRICLGGGRNRADARCGGLRDGAQPAAHPADPASDARRPRGGLARDRHARGAVVRPRRDPHLVGDHRRHCRRSRCCSP